MAYGYDRVIVPNTKASVQRHYIGIDGAPFQLPSHVLQRVSRTSALGACQFTAELEHPLPAMLSRASEKRKAEYLTARTCAAALLRQLDAPVFHVGTADDRAPIWPCGYVGSITHTSTLVAVAVSRAASCRSLGIDAEILLDDKGLADIERYCLLPQEKCWFDHFRSLPQTHIGTLLFSAKEAFYKCLYPHVRQYIDFMDAEVEMIVGTTGSLRLRLLRSPTAVFPKGFALDGTFRFAEDHVFTAFELGNV